MLFFLCVCGFFAVSPFSPDLVPFRFIWLRSNHSCPLQICMQDKRYTNQVLASAIQQLADSSPVPSLTMRTAMVSYKKYPAMKQFLIGMYRMQLSECNLSDPLLFKGY